MIRARDPLVNIVSVKRQDLQNLLDYPEDDELQHWEETGRPSDHIYTTIRSLKRQMRAQNFSKPNDA